MANFFIFANLVLLFLTCNYGYYVEAHHINSPRSMKWQDFKDYHGKKYHNEAHESLHKSIFLKHAAEVAKHNEAFRHGKVNYTKELNKFADMDPEVFNQRNGFVVPKHMSHNNHLHLHLSDTPLDVQCPASFDWRKKHMVSPVKDQGQCGSCWAFSATGAVESQVLISGQPAQSLSEQDIVSCDLKDGNAGCNGGWYYGAYQFIQRQGGIPTEAAYPYRSGTTQQTGTCHKPPTNSSSFASGVNVATYQRVSQNVNAIKAALVQYGPLNIAVDAYDWQLACDGIYSCTQPQINHAVLLVGYGSTHDGTPYWIVKNCWGSNWGDKGYLKVAQNPDQDCGLSKYATYVQIYQKLG